jgi:hypothetical protein
MRYPKSVFEYFTSQRMEISYQELLEYEQIAPVLRIANNPQDIVVTWSLLPPKLKWVLSRPYIEPLSVKWFEKRQLYNITQYNTIH